MKLTHIDLPAFRSCRGIQLTTDSRRVLIAGRNGSGKSTVANAIRWALTGHCDGTDARGAGAEVLIPHGLDAAKVGVTLDGIGFLSTTFNGHGGSFSVEGFTGTSQIQRGALYGKLGTTPEYLNAVLDTAVFLDLAHGDAKALVLSLLGVTIQSEDKSYTLDELDAAYTLAFADRKAAKKVLAGLVLPPAPVETKIPQVASIEKRLADVRVKAGALQKAVGSVIGKRDALTAEGAWLSVERPIPEDVSGQIAEFERKVAELEAIAVPVIKTPPPAKGDPQRLIFLTGVKNAIARYTPSGRCVLDDGIPCLTLAVKFSDRLDELKAEMEDLTPANPADSPPAAESPLTGLRRHLQVFQRQQDARTAALDEAERADARLTQIHQELDALPDVADKEAELATETERIVKGERLLQDARAHWQAVERHDKAKTARTAQEAEVERLEAAVEHLGPKGVRVPALAEAIGSFEAAVNPYVEPFGWTLSFSVEPWTVFANGRSVETYSRSERYRIGIALQMGIAMLSGLSFAVIDEVDMLDAANRAAMTKMLMSAPLEQIFILGTREPSQPLKPIEGVVAYRLVNDEGTTRIAERCPADD